MASARASRSVRPALAFWSRATSAASGFTAAVFGPRLAGVSALEGPGVALPPPVGEGRGVDPLAAQNGADTAGFSGAIGIGEDAQLVLRRERPATRASR